MIRRGGTPRRPAPSRRSNARPLDIAVVGMACRFPGADTLEEFWRNVLDGRDCISDVPANRWQTDQRFPGTTHEGKPPAGLSRGGFLREPVQFDAARLGIMPRAVDGGEPEQFLLLDTALAAIRDAGLEGRIDDGRRVDVIVGRGNYFNRGNLNRLQHGRLLSQTLGILQSLHPEWTADDLRAVQRDLAESLPPLEPSTVASQVTNATASRVADRLNLKGASYVVDAASGSALVALELAARSLVEGRCDLALAGSVYIATDADFYQLFHLLGILSRDGQPRPFAAEADGMVPGEGVGVVVLKRLADAERDGDRIYAVLKGVGLASDGRAAGLTAPSAAGHARAMRRALKSARIEPSTVGWIEGHGLGVPAADRAELRALHRVYSEPIPGGRALGAVSALIGHAMPAAGMAGLIKTCLALHHRARPASERGQQPHPLLSEGAAFEWGQGTRPWVHGMSQYPRRAAVNAFGLAGVNAHALLEEHRSPTEATAPGCLASWETEAILLGASDRESVRQLALALRDWLETGTNVRVALKDLAATLNRRLSRFPVRVGLVVSSTRDLSERLRWLAARLDDPACQSIHDARGTYYWEAPLASNGGRLAFLFAGEGSQYSGMLADLCVHFPEVRRMLDTADRLALESDYEHLPSVALFDRRAAGLDVLWKIGTAVNTVLSAHWGLKLLLDKLGIQPDVVVGHSSGEILALASAGVIQEGPALENHLGTLGRCFERLEKENQLPQARLVAVASNRERVEAACAQVGGVSVAMDNCPHQIVVAGASDRVERVVDSLRASGVLTEPLPFDRAYHTEAFRRSLGPLRESFEQLAIQPPRLPVYSCSTASLMPAEPAALLDVAVEQWARPVEFSRTVRKLHEDGVRIFVEVGARGNLTGCVNDILRDRTHFAISAGLPRRSGLTQLNHLVAALYAQGVELETEHLYARRRPTPVDLSRDLPEPRVLTPIELGFPEMRLSPEMVARLSSRVTSSLAAVATRPPESDDPAPAPRNGFARNGHGRAKLNGHAPSVRATPFPPEASHGISVEQLLAPGVEALASSRATLPAGMSESAALSFFQTMDLFLETQRQVLAAYLETPSQPPVTDQEDPRIKKNGGLSGTAPHRDEIQPAAVDRAAESVTVAIQGAAPSEEGPGDAKEILLDLVTRRTGYPVEMLDLAYDMEADLGIDSIKRVEILGELQDRGFVPESLDVDRLARARTLGDVLGLLRDGRVAPLEPTPRRAWPGRVERLDEGREFLGTWRLDAATDPVAHHHTLGGRRLSAVEPDRLGLPVLPFTVLAEILAQAAAQLYPDRTVVALRDVQANRWVAYEPEPSDLEVHAVCVEGRADEVRVGLRPRSGDGVRRNGSAGLAFEGTVVFSERLSDLPARVLPDLATSRVCSRTAEELYRDQWLFHGPALQALVDVRGSDSGGIDGTLRVLPHEPLLRASIWPVRHSDPIVLDAFTHLLGAWGIDGQAGSEGSVMFPLRVHAMAWGGEPPAVGTELDCRIRIRELTRHRVRVDAELIRPDQSVWIRITGWEDWRFYWPDRVRDVLRAPDRIFAGEELALASQAGRAVAVWLEPPSDMAKPVWRNVLEWTQLSPEEQRSLRGRGDSEVVRTLRIWGRMAAKEAVRRLWHDEGRAPVYPADLIVANNAEGQPFLRSRLEPGRQAFPTLSIAHAEGVAVAVAAADPGAFVGIDVELIRAREDGFENVAFSDDERRWLDDNTTTEVDRNEWVARFWCCKEAAAKATGLGLVAGPTSLAIVTAARESGEVLVQLVEELTERLGGRFPREWTCHSGRRGEYAWAWTITGGEGHPA